MGTRLYSREMRAAIAITICLLALVSALPVEEQPEQTSRDPVLAMMQDAIDSEATSSEATLEATHEKAKWGKAKWVHALTRAPAHGWGRRRATKTPSRPTKPKPTSKPCPVPMCPKVMPKPGCSRIKSDEKNKLGCPLHPCGKLVCKVIKTPEVPCPSPSCTHGPPGCKYLISTEKKANGCLRYPCGKLACDLNKLVNQHVRG